MYRVSEENTLWKEYDDNMKLMYFFIIYVKGLRNRRMEN